MPVFVKAIKRINDKEIDLAADTIKVMLLTNALTVDQDAQEFIDDISANEAVVTGGGTGYTAGGAALASKTVTADTGTSRVKFDAVDPTWTPAGGNLTARYAAVYQDTGDPATSPILATIDFGADKTATDGNPFLIQFAASGIFYYQV